MKNLIYPCCGKRLVNTSPEASMSLFWCDICDLDIDLNKEPETPVSISDDYIRVDWYNAGEGYFGDFDPENSKDDNLLRFDVCFNPYYSPNTKFEYVDWEEVEDASYCTLVPADTDIELLVRLCWCIFKEYRDVIDSYPDSSLKKLGENLSHISAYSLDTTPIVLPEDPKECAAVLRSKLKNAFQRIKIVYKGREIVIRLLSEVRPDCESELWFGGLVASLMSEDIKLSVRAVGDVYASLAYDGVELVRVKDKNNSGVFGFEISRYLSSDKELLDAIERGEDECTEGYSIYLESGNWFEVFDEKRTDSSFVAENSDNIYEAIAEAIINMDWFEEK